MKRPVLTPELVAAAARDAANRSARAAGRAAWSVDDWNAACAEYDRLLPALNGEVISK